MILPIRFSTYLFFLSVLTSPSTAVSAYIYDVAIDYLGGYSYSFSMEFLDSKGQKGVSDLVGGNFQNKVFRDSSGDVWAPSKNIFTSVVDPAPTYLSFDPSTKNIQFTSTNWFRDPSPAPFVGAMTTSQGHDGAALSENRTPLSATARATPTESVSVVLSSSPSSPTFGNPQIDPSLKIWARDAQELFLRTDNFLTFFGDIAAYVEGKTLKEIATNRLFELTIEHLSQITDGAGDDIMVEMYMQIEILDDLFAYTTAPFSATVAGATQINKGLTLALGEIVEDPPRYDFDKVQDLRSPFDPENWGGLFSGGALPQAYIDAISCSADMADGSYAMLLAAERAWGAAILGSSSALALQGGAYRVAAEKTNNSLQRCVTVFQSLSTLQPDIQTLEALNQIERQLIADDDIKNIREFLLNAEFFDVYDIENALALAYNDEAFYLNSYILEDFRDVAERIVALGPAPEALRQSQVPEPAMLSLLALAFGMLGLLQRPYFRRLCKSKRGYK